MASATVEAKYGPVVAVVNSKSEPDKRYEVRHATDGSYSCQCAGYRFSKERPRQCRHIRATTAEIASGVPITQPLGAAVPSRTQVAPKPQRSVREEARAAAEDLAKSRSVGSFILDATNRIEAAIRAILAQSSAAVAQVAMPVGATGIRMICLDD